MKASLSFDISDFDDEQKLRRMLDSSNFLCLLSNIDEELRYISKYQEQDKMMYRGESINSVFDLIDAIREHIHDEIDLDFYGY